ncbi:MAG: HlyD family efflux transporter periplasmic adaptor subunit [Paracoccaceae bacterium]|nr:HlyD family efflux transporter periplasmic adaptor subunit [Paracoccaceae bacterium]
MTPLKLGLALSVLTFPALAQDTFQIINLAGTVVADNKTGLSYQARGCITGRSQTAVKSGKATAGQMLVELDDRAATLAVKSGKARVNDLEAAVDERNFAITVAKANVARVKEEQEFVDREFERTRVLFQRGLLDETKLEAAERRKLDATFAVDRMEEALERAVSAKFRANIALEIGQLEVQARELDLEALTVRSPFDGVLLNFEPNIGDCVSEGSLAAQIYAPDEKSVETFVFVDQLVDTLSGGVVVGNPVNIIRINGQTCPGVFSLVGTEANLESQKVKTTIELDASCAMTMFLNEAVGIETLPASG